MTNKSGSPAASFDRLAKPKNTIPRVFVLEPKQNVPIDAAKEHGEILTIFASSYGNPKFVDKNYIDILIERLEEENYNPSVDFILVVGHMSSVVILVGSIMREYIDDADEPLKLLVWNSWIEKYVVKEI